VPEIGHGDSGDHYPATFTVGTLCERIKTAPDIDPHEVVEGDGMISRRTLAYFKKRGTQHYVHAAPELTGAGRR
jgi:hypothetical protein